MQTQPHATPGTIITTRDTRFRMVQAMREGAQTRDDLKALGFTDLQIEHYGADAAADARRASERTVAR